MSPRASDSMVHASDCPFSPFLPGSLPAQVSLPPGSLPSSLTPIPQAWCEILSLVLLQRLVLLKNLLWSVFCSLLHLLHQTGSSLRAGVEPRASLFLAHDTSPGTRVNGSTMCAWKCSKNASHCSKPSGVNVIQKVDP